MAPPSKSRIKKDTQKYMALTEKGVRAFQEGQHRASADYYLDAVLVAPDKWMDMTSSAPSSRYHTFHGYTSILREKYFAPSENDFKMLRKKFLQNEEEPVIFRVEAAFTLGLLSWDKGDREAAGEYYRDVLGIGNQQVTTRDEEERRYVATEQGPPIRSVLKKVKDGIQETMKQAQDNLDQLEHKTRGNFPFASASSSSSSEPRSFPRSDGTSFPSEKRGTGFYPGTVKKYTNLEPEALMARLAVGGNACDCCQKSLNELGMSKLLCCTRCQRAYYCSKACQIQQWKQQKNGGGGGGGGHKKCCREPGEIQSNDMMQIRNLNGARSDLNGMVAMVMDKDPNKEGRWKVRVMNYSGEVVSVSEKNIEHIRPEK